MTMEKKEIRVLLVEDDQTLSKGLQYTLEKEGYAVEPAASLHRARELFFAGTFELVLLDVGLPDGSGFDFCTEIRNSSDVPVLFLTACDEEVNVVMGLDMGGDDYITKPFRVNELVSRIRAVLRRRGQGPETGILRAGRFTLDRETCRVRKEGNSLDLTATEFRLIRILMDNRPNVITRERLIELLWDSDGHFVDSNTLSVYIRRLREKVEDDPQNPVHIRTVRGLGYRWQ